MAHVHVERQARAHDHEEDKRDDVEEAHDDLHRWEGGEDRIEELTRAPGRSSNAEHTVVFTSIIAYE